MIGLAGLVAHVRSVKAIARYARSVKRLVLKWRTASMENDQLVQIVDGVVRPVPWCGKPGEAHMATANALVNGDRQDAYGSPRRSYEAVAQVWSGLLWDKLTIPLTPEDCVLMMTALKLQREAHKHKDDNLVDAHGYLLVLAHVRDGQ